MQFENRYQEKSITKYDLDAMLPSEKDQDCSTTQDIPGVWRNRINSNVEEKDSWKSNVVFNLKFIWNNISLYNYYQ